MLEKQQTIKSEVTLSGVGLHTGNKSNMTFKPAPENYGVKFKRTDLQNSPEIPADIDHVIVISRGTTIALGGVEVHTVEHVLAAIAGLQIDNINVELDGIEPPIGDGSAISYVNALLEAGIEQQDAPKDYLIIDELSYRLREPERQEVIVFKYPNNPSLKYIKRVIGLPGEKVEIVNGQVFVTSGNKTF